MTSVGRLEFSKMEGCGNDFVVVASASLDGMADDRQALQRFVRRVCDRHFGIGADGLLAWEARIAQGDLHVRMHYWNADGSRAEMCGNGARCVVRHAWEATGRPAGAIHLRTDLGVRPAEVQDTGGDVVISVDMGPVTWDPAQIPFDATEPAIDVAVDLPGGARDVSACGIGNPHGIVFVDSSAALEELDLDGVGRALSQHPRFPHGANASFVSLEAGVLTLRVWERGVGPTLACGTASCAALAAARRTRRLEGSEAIVQLPGGRVSVRQDDAGHLWLTGPARTVARGTLEPEWLDRRSP